MHIKNWRNKNYLVLTRKKGSLLEKCPFCGSRHLHGAGDGHRNAHCNSGENTMQEIEIRDTKVFRKDGYFIETI